MLTRAGLFVALRGLSVAGLILLAGACQKTADCHTTDPSCSLSGYWILVVVNRAPWLVFNGQMSGNEEIWKIRADGTELAQLTADAAIDAQAEFSPDGSQIAFRSTRSGNDDIWIMQADGSNLRQLTTDPASDQHPTWSSDGLRIAYQSNRSGNNDIWIESATGGGGALQLTTDVNSDQRPYFAPITNRLVFSSPRNGGNWDIFVRNGDGSGVDERLTSVASTEGRPCFAPDESFMLLNSNASGLEQVWRRNADGSLEQLTFSSTPTFAPTLSPDATRFAYTTSAGLVVRQASGVDVALVSGVISFPRFARR
jgi:Tol biopolymer transport system component